MVSLESIYNLTDLIYGSSYRVKVIEITMKMVISDWIIAIDAKKRRLY